MDKLYASGVYGDVYSGFIDGVEYVKKVARTDSDFIAKGPTESYIREVDILRRCSHPNIVRLVDTDPENSSILLEKGVMNLEEFLEENRGRTSFLPLLKDVARGLYYLEQKNIYHGDIKPENIVIFEGENGYVAKLIDFGVSYINVHKGMFQYYTGTFPWQSPEGMHYTLFKEGYRNFKALSWTFGILLLECLSAENIDEVETYEELFELVGVPSIDEKYVRDLAPELANSARSSHLVDKKLDDLVEKCLQWDPEKRVSMYEICKILGLQVDLPLSSIQKLDRNKEKVAFPWHYEMFLVRMREFFENLDNDEEKYHAPLALSIFLRSKEEDSEIVLFACLSIASKLYGSYFSEFLYGEDEDQGDEIAETEVRIFKVLGDIVVRTTSLDYRNLEGENLEEERLDYVNAWIDTILSGENYDDLFVY